MKKIKYILLAFIFSISLSSCQKGLPNPTTIEGQWAMFEIDKNINVTTIDKYLNRKDTVYRDMRMLIDDADFTFLPDGDSYLSGYIKGFSVVPFPFLSDKLDLPIEAGVGYTGPTLYSYIDGEHVANYEESLIILETLFPKDKNIFLMCGAGGYAQSTKNFLIALGWNKDKIWNIGCYWSYIGKNNVNIKKVNDKGQEYYAFYEVSYHFIDFEELNQK